MAFEYLVVSSGSQLLNKQMLDSLGASNWDLVQVVTPAGSLNVTYIFKK